MAVWGSWRAFKRRGAPIGSICTEFQLKPSHGDPYRVPNHHLLKTVFSLVLTNSHLVLTMDCLVVTIDYLVVTIDYLVVTIDYFGIDQWLLGIDQ